MRFRTFSESETKKSLAEIVLAIIFACEKQTSASIDWLAN